MFIAYFIFITNLDLCNVENLAYIRIHLSISTYVLEIELSAYLDFESPPQKWMFEE